MDVRAALKGRASPELVTSLERMLEPDPDLRAPSVGAALDVPLAGSPSVAPPPSRTRAPVARASSTSEEAAAKSIRGLLWALWGLGWVLVPLIFGKILGEPVAIPVVMFGWMALNVILGWHKGALIRAAIRQWNAEKTRPAAIHHRVEVDDAQQQVRVHTTDLGPDEVVAGTEVQSSDDRARRRAR